MSTQHVPLYQANFGLNKREKLKHEGRQYRQISKVWLSTGTDWLLFFSAYLLD